MKIIYFILPVLALMLAACAPAEKNAQMSALWNKYNDHCAAHAREASTKGSPDEESIYRECMDYFIKANINCSYCVVKAKQ